jgi:hypothetical protein
MTNQHEQHDHGVISDSRKRSVAWVLIFPLIAAAATAWFLWTDYKSMGPEIEISFDEVPGIQAGKTPLVYRGVDAGTVSAVELDKNLNKVLVKVRLKEFAAGLASEETDFWVENLSSPLRSSLVWNPSSKATRSALATPAVNRRPILLDSPSLHSCRFCPDLSLCASRARRFLS